MGRMYTAPISAVSVAAAIEDLWHVKVGTGIAFILHEVVVTQDGSETSEQLPLQIFRTASDKSGVGTSLTPVKCDAGDAAAVSTVRYALTGSDLSTVTTLMFRQSQNVLGGWHFLWTPESRPVFTAGTNFAIGLPTAPAGTLAFSGYIVFEEIGG